LFWRHTAIQYALFDAVTACMRIVSAGMPGPLLLRGGDSRVPEAASPPPSSRTSPKTSLPCNSNPAIPCFFHRWP